MAYRDFKDFPRRTIADKIPHDEASDIAKNVESMMDANVDLLPWLINVLMKKASNTAKEHEIIVV